MVAKLSPSNRGGGCKVSVNEIEVPKRYQVDRVKEKSGLCGLRCNSKV